MCSSESTQGLSSTEASAAAAVFLQLRPSHSASGVREGQCGGRAAKGRCLCWRLGKHEVRRARPRGGSHPEARHTPLPRLHDSCVSAAAPPLALERQAQLALKNKKPRERRLLCVRATLLLQPSRRRSRRSGLSAHARLGTTGPSSPRSGCSLWRWVKGGGWGLGRGSGSWGPGFAARVASATAHRGAGD